MVDQQQPPGLLGMFGGGGGQQQQGVGGLLGALDPEKMAYLGMMLKGLSPYSSIDSEGMLKLAQAKQQNAAELALKTRQQQFTEGQASQLNDFRERQLAQQNVTPAAKAAADFGLTKDNGTGPGTQAYKDFMSSFYQLKGEGYTAVTIDDGSGEKRTVFQDKQGNFKTPEQVGIVPAATPASGANAIPPPPPGADPKEWRRKQTDMRAAEEAQRPGRQATAGRLVEDIDRAQNIIDTSILPTTGLIGGQALSKIGGTAAHDLSATLESIGANISFDKLQQMRSQSPTGGALGNVSDKDINLLKSTLGSIRQSQTAGDLKFNLDRLRKQYDEVIHGPGGGGPSSPQQTPSQRKTINGKGYSKIGGQWYED